MKHMIRTLAAVLALMLLCSCAALAEDPAATVFSCTTSCYLDDTGAWSLEMDWYSSDLLLLSIEHSITETEHEIWAISVDNADESENEYTDAFCARVTVDSEDGAIQDSETVYDDGTGSIAIDGDTVTWTDHASEVSIVFAMISSKTTDYRMAENGAEMSAVSSDEINSQLITEIVLSEDDGTTTAWDLVLVWSDSANAYTYEDGICTRITYEGEEANETTLYTDGTGTFALMNDGSLQWTSGTGDYGSGWIFVPETVEDQMY